MTSLLLLGGALLLAGTVHAAGDVAAGKAKSEPCADCHGDDGWGDKKDPPIAGMNPEKFFKAMKDYQSGARHKSNMMARSVKKHIKSDQDIEDLAAYYASLPKKK